MLVAMIALHGKVALSLGVAALLIVGALLIASALPRARKSSRTPASLRWFLRIIGTSDHDLIVNHLVVGAIAIVMAVVIVISMNVGAVR